MFDFLKNVRWSLLFIGLINIGIGIAMVMYPETSSDMVVKIIGGIMAAAAIVSILGYFVDRKRGLTSYTNMLVGAIMLIMGAVLFISPKTFEPFLGYIFAAIVLVQGINLIVEGISHKKYQSSHWGQTLLMGLICVALAVIVFINPFNTFKALMIMTGVALVISGLLNVLVAGRIGAAVHTFNKAVKVAEAELIEEKDAVEAELKDAKEAEETIETIEAIETVETKEEVSEETPAKLDEIKLDFSDNKE